jgi:hypothetical protein
MLPPPLPPPLLLGGSAAAEAVQPDFARSGGPPVFSAALPSGCPGHEPDWYDTSPPFFSCPNTSCSLFCIGTMIFLNAMHSPRSFNTKRKCSERRGPEQNAWICKCEYQVLHQLTTANFLGAQDWLRVQFQVARCICNVLWGPQTASKLNSSKHSRNL